MTYVLPMPVWPEAPETAPKGRKRAQTALVAHSTATAPTAPIGLFVANQATGSTVAPQTKGRPPQAKPLPMPDWPV